MWFFHINQKILIWVYLKFIELGTFKYTIFLILMIKNVTVNISMSCRFILNQ